MGWTTPKTWAVGEVLTAADMNTYIKDNMDFLFDRPNDSFEFDLTGTDWTTTSTTMVAVDVAKFHLSIESGNHVAVHFHGTMQLSTINSTMNLDIYVDGVRVGDSVGGILGWKALAANDRKAITFTRLVGPLSPGVHTIELYWLVSAGTGSIKNAVPGTAGSAMGQFWVHEL